MEERKVEILNSFFTQYVFLPKRKADYSWLDGADVIVKTFIGELKNPTIQKVLNFFTVSGDLDNIDSYQKILDFAQKCKDDSIKFILNLNSRETELDYLKTLMVHINEYKQNRKKSIEKAYEFCANKGIEVWTLPCAENNLYMVEEIYNSLPNDIDERDKIFQLRIKLRHINEE